MKFVDTTPLAYLSSEIPSYVDQGETVISFRCELYTHSRAKSARKMHSDLENRYKEEVANSPDETLSTSPFGNMAVKRNRLAMIDMIATLNSAYPDYDFQGVHPTEFQHHSNKQDVFLKLDSLMQNMPAYSSVRSNFWKAVDEEVHLKSCSIYSYIPDPDSSPFNWSMENSLWCYNFLFYSPHLKRVLLFTISSRWKRHFSSEEDEYYYDMDIENDFEFDYMFEY
eukprot:TRINITY_DN1692_c0_g2_i1.p1 TRINITY_DN1692_c0_g2~~TRINITY_DN1692_c0_g2_i1.p1  ORF type:complete len:225 (-),score=25.95 TRINITY_DN1692_c0_g2_i1:63-737(-)